jgi:CelD/BcsL family acetyltransferase involved in cellulose biosynthesis
MLAVETEMSPRSDSAPDGQACSVHVCNTWVEFERFRGEWNTLLQAKAASSIFQTPEWLAAWWQAFGKEKRFLGLIIADAEGKTVGVVPLFADQRPFFGRTVTTLRMIGAGSGDSDALDFVTAPGYEILCAEAFINWLVQQADWDVCALETLPQNSRVAQHLSRYVQQAGWSIDSTLTPNFIVDLPAAWPQYLSTLEPSFRPLLTRYPRRLQSRYSVRFVRSERVEDLKEQLQTLFSLHQMRWTDRGKSGAFASADRRDFYYNMAAAFLQRGWLEFWLLELDGEIVGAQFCFRYNDTVSLLQEGFHPKYAAEKIGYALRAHVLEEMIRSGVKKYDFLGGNDPYKAKFGAHQENYLNLFFAGPSRTGRAFVAAQRRTRLIKAWLKSKLPAGVLARIRHDSTAQVHGPSQ